MVRNCFLVLIYVRLSFEVMIMCCSSVPIVSSYGISFSSLWILLALVCHAPLSLHGLWITRTGTNSFLWIKSWTLEALKDIVQGFTTDLAISEAEAFEIVCVEELSKLKADRFLLVGRLLTAKPFHKEALFGTIKNIENLA
ncbi:unnamed protein product [Prunus brigantina]